MRKKATQRPHRYLSPEFEATAALISYEQNSLTITEKIQSNLKAQNGSLSERVSVRRHSRNNINLPLYLTAANSSGSVKRIEEEIEDILVEKFAKIKDVKRRYKLKMKGGSIAKMVEEMNLEVENIEVEFAERKKKVLSGL